MLSKNNNSKIWFFPFFCMTFSSAHAVDEKLAFQLAQTETVLKRHNVNPLTHEVIQDQIHNGEVSEYDDGGEKESKLDEHIPIILDIKKSNPEEEDFKQIRKHVARIHKKMSLLDSAQETVLVLGNKGAGKSTLVQYLTETPDQPYLRAVAGRVGRICIESFDPKTKGAIKEGTVSVTTDPVEYGIYWDCPGFNDSRGAVQDIVNAYEIRILSSHLTAGSHRAKILIATALSELDAVRSAPFLEMISHIGKMFQENMDQLAMGLCLVFTKGERVVFVESMKEEFKKIQEEQGNGLSLFQRQMLDTLIGLDNRFITFFPSPRQLGYLSDEEKIYIKGALDLITTPLSGLSPHLSIAPESYLHIEHLNKYINTEMSGILDYFKNQISEYTKQFIQSHAGMMAAGIRNCFEDIFKKSRTLSFDDNNFNQDYNIVNGILQTLGVKKERIALEHHMGNMALLELIKPEDCVLRKDGNMWRIVSEICQNFESFSRMDTPVFNHNTLTLKGVIVGTSDVHLSLQNHPEVSDVSVYCFHNFIDQDLTARGIDVSFFAPDWWMTGTKSIILKGKNGDNHQHAAANGIDPGSSGVDGKPGKPGQNGGYFYGKLDTFHGNSELTIDVGGGNGGNGQNGGNGTRGSDGENGVLDHIRNRQVEALHERRKVDRNYAVAALSFVFTPLNNKYRETYKSGTEAISGGHGGRGGKGGYGGKSGSIQINDPNNVLLELINDISEDGNNGVNGIPGIGAEGGRYSIYQRVYIAEYIAPFFRNIDVVDRNVLGVGVHGVPAAIGAAAHAAPAIARWWGAAAVTSAGKSAVVFARLGVGGVIGAIITIVPTVAVSVISPYASSGWENPSIIDWENPLIRRTGNAIAGIQAADINEQGIIPIAISDEAERENDLITKNSSYTDYIVSYNNNLIIKPNNIV